MKELRYVKVKEREIPVLISDENEALLAAKAAGGAIVGLWGPEKGESWCCADFVAESMEAIDDGYLERVARRSLGLPWNICETRRLSIREIAWDDFQEIWENHVGRGFESIEALESYTKHQYRFYGFGFWALVEKRHGTLVGVAGLTVPREYEDDGGEWYAAEAAPGAGTASGPGAVPLSLEIGYHIFPPFRRLGLAAEACAAIMEYGRDELGAGRFLARIRKKNEASLALARSLGFRKGTEP